MTGCSSDTGSNTSWNGSNRGQTQPYDCAIGDDNVYLSLRETASFGGGPSVTFDLLIDTTFVEGKMARLEMFVDDRPIDGAYPADAD